MNSKPIPVDQIKQLANDIRLIKDFSENQNFDASLISATIEPKETNARSKDWPVICMAAFTTLLLTVVAILNFWSGLPPSGGKFLFVIGLLLVVLATVSAHKKFENTVITIVVGGGLVLVLLVGAGVFTPREAIDEIQRLKSSK